ncbi:acyl-CoA thioesterase/bile acid-CoA:amino acid N-acyltransferase family protein [Salinicoccus hispanicus]|uniref:Acyl-CoA thioesterase n=1 Tax=Salinicoccus hispanicus TaxID=157225 RepID=A0A6N8U1T5_9STAP|nr:acyl-CoA thioesterase/bile acid-CoA:amino acid N-acyltransferase family protein [Salinicoccus hispanicus]MXQ52060.1 hypothetical protein [Salinicoccus hispanicus]
MSRIVMEQDELLIDQPLNLKAIDCTPGDIIHISAEMFDEENKLFHSYASFLVKDSGIVDLAIDIPIEGTYDSEDAAGLLWSMILKETDEDDYFVKKTDRNLSVKFQLRHQEEIMDSKDISIKFMNDDVKRLDITESGIVGNLYAPSGGGKYPSVIILSGSDGGNESHASSYLASEGYLVLALSYFNDTGLRPNLENIELEYFKDAAAFLKSHENSNGSVNLIGYSKGAELVLLLGEKYDGYHSIIAGAPSIHITSGMKNGMFAPITGWVQNDAPLPFLKMKFSMRMILKSMKGWIMKKPFNFLDVWDKSLRTEKASESRIDVQKITCPLLVIAGGDDQLWPSKSHTENIEAQREDVRDKYLIYEAGGHFISFPYNFHQMPANVNMKIGKMTMNFGGSKKTNAKASKQSLEEILSFLHAHNEGRDV